MLTHDRQNIPMQANLIAKNATQPTFISANRNIRAISPIISDNMNLNTLIIKVFKK